MDFLRRLLSKPKSALIISAVICVLFMILLALGIANGLDEAPADAVEKPVLEDLDHQLQTKLSPFASKWDIWVEDLNSGEHVHCTHNVPEDHEMISASLIKLFIMGAVYEKIEQGIIAEESVWSQLYQMITISDNDAANELTLLLGSGDAAAGREAVTAWAKSIGCDHVRHNRLMLEENGLQNYVSAQDCATILGMIYHGACVSEYSSSRMLEMLKDQYYNTYLPAGVPESTPVAHKTGDLIGLCVGDVGIVLDSKNPYLICVICNDPISYSGAGIEIGRISKIVYDFLGDDK